jgi:hypothetical protein
MRLAAFLVLAAGIAAVTAPAEGAMYKCAKRDGTVLYQAKPCSDGDRELAVSGSVAPAGSGTADPVSRKLADNDPRLQAMRNGNTAEERAVMDRDLAQRRDRCRSAREMIERQKPLLEGSSEVARQHAGNEIKTQERRMREDRCDAV